MSNSYKVFKGRVLLFGDLHLSSVYQGQHKDYTLECYTNMDNISKKVKAEKASAVFLLGDLIGVNERNIRDRQFLLRVVLFLRTLNELTNGNVFIVKGNHDKGDFSDFDFLVGMGLIKNPKYVDYYGCSKEEYAELGDDALEVRFHFVNYGEETRELDISSDAEYSNVVLGHADYLIDNVTNWYQHKGGVQVSKLVNFKGVELIISGHIHNPSTQIDSTNIGEETIGLFYVGSPSRTAERYDDCWYVSFEYVVGEDGVGSTEYGAQLFGLAKADEVFYPKEDFINDEDYDDVTDEETESLTSIVKEIMEGRMTSGDLFGQIKSVPGASDEVKNIACEYLQRAIDMSN